MRLSPNLLAIVAATGVLGLPSRATGEPLPNPSDAFPESSPTLSADVESTTASPGAYRLSNESPDLDEHGHHQVAVADLESPAALLTPATGVSTETSTMLAAPLERLDGHPPLPIFSGRSLSQAPAMTAPIPTVYERPSFTTAKQAPTDSLEEQPDSPSPEEAPPNLDTTPEPESPPDPAAPVDGPVDSPEEPGPEEPGPEEPGPEEPGPEEEPVDDEAAEEERVLVAEVAVEPVAGQLDEALRQEVYDAIGTRPGRTTTRSQLQRDINNIFATGFFSNVRAVPEDTPLGVRVTFIVQPNPVLQSVVVRGNQVLPQSVVDDIFSPQYGEIINLIDFQDGIIELNEWYQDNGYVLAQVIAAPQVSDDGVVTLEVAEGEIADIRVRFITSEGETEDEEGNPIRGRTRDFIVTREFETQPGEVFQQSRIERDLQRVFGLGIFEDVRLSLEPAQEDPRQVDVVVNIAERNTGSVAAGIGFNFTGDLFGSVSYRQDNFGGNNQKFVAETQVGQDLLFDVSFTDPWIAGDPFRTSYTVNGFSRRSINLNFDGGPNPVELPNGDRVRVRRLGGGVSFSRPFDNGWTVSVGTQYQNVSTRDSDGELEAVDELGNPLSASSTGQDDLWTFPVSAVLDLRDDRFNPTQGSILRLTSEQSVPLGRGSILLNRLRASYSYYIPVRLINFSDGPQAFALNVQAGTILGDLPPYEAFALGGTNSVRGYDEGDVGSGRSFAQFTAEYRFPLFSFLGAAVFIDAASDLGSGFAIPGAPGPTRGKPGSGFGYGAGLRVQTPLGPLRIDYGVNDEGDGRLHFGIGERF